MTVNCGKPGLGFVRCGQFGPQSTVCILDGYFKVDNAGYFIFEVGDGNENTRLEVANLTILGPHFQKGIGENFMLPLERGYYPFKITYFHQKGEAIPAPLYVKLEEIEDFELPASMLFSLNQWPEIKRPGVSIFDPKICKSL